MKWTRSFPSVKGMSSGNVEGWEVHLVTAILVVPAALAGERALSHWGHGMSLPVTCFLGFAIFFFIAMQLFGFFGAYQLVAGEKALVFRVGFFAIYGAYAAFLMHVAEGQGTSIHSGLVWSQSLIALALSFLDWREWEDGDLLWLGVPTVLLYGGVLYLVG